MPVTLEQTETAILDRTINPAEGSWPPAAARSILDLSLTKADAQRRDDLAEKARQGTLSEDEASEFQNYRHVGRLLELMKAKAKLSLTKSRGAS